MEEPEEKGYRRIAQIMELEAEQEIRVAME